MQKYIYDVYSKDGSKIMSQVTSIDISKALGVNLSKVSDYAKKEKLYKRTYRFVIVGKQERAESKDDIPVQMLKEWDNVRNLFRNVVWVKEYSSGAKILKVGC